jgi:hypothetical protein
MEEYTNIFESVHPNKIKTQPKGSIMLVDTPPPKGKRVPIQFKKSCCLCGKHGHKSVDCYSRPDNAHKKPGYKANNQLQQELPSHAPIARKLDIQRSNVERRRMRKENQMI